MIDELLFGFVQLFLHFLAIDEYLFAEAALIECVVE